MTKSKKKKIMVLGLIALFFFVCLIGIVGIIWAVAIGIVGMLFLHGGDNKGALVINDEKGIYTCFTHYLKAYQFVFSFQEA